MWVGAPTSTGFRVTAKIGGHLARLCVSTSQGGIFTSPVWSGTANVTPEGVVSLTVSELTPATQYYYGYEIDGVQQATTGRARTTPTPGTPATFKFGASSCSGHYNNTVSIDGGTTFWPPNSGTTDVSNHRAFNDILTHDPDIFIHMGDLHYRDYNENNPALWREGYDDVLSAPNQAALYQNVPIVYTWDDHDYCGNDSNITSAGRSAAAQVYRERVPHYPLNDSANIGVWQTWVVGRVRFIMTDARTYQDPMTDPDHEDHNALGPEQEAWLLRTMKDAQEPLICWVNPMPWAANMNQGNWDKFAYERNRITKFLIDNGLNRRMFMVSGDWHGMGFDDGRNNKFGGFPIYQLSALDSAPSGSFAGTFSHGANRSRGQYGIISIHDDGNEITVSAEGYKNDELLLSHSFRLGEFAIPPGERVTETVAVKASHVGDESARAWKTIYNGQVVNVIAAHVGAMST